MNYIAQRQQSLARNKKDGIDAVLITTPVNVTYLTRFTGDSSFYLSTPKNNILVSDARFEEQIKEEVRDIDVHIRPHNETTYEAAVAVLVKSGAKNVAVEGNRITHEELETLRSLSPKLTFVPQNKMVESQRVIKDPSEVENIREAVRVAERAYKMFIATIRESDTEKDMSDALECYVRRAGGRGTPFTPITAVGERGALPHAPPTDRQLGDGSKLLVDWGADMLYKCDITRTLRSPFGTAPTRKNKHERVGYDFEFLYNVVLEAQNAAIATIRHGVKAKDVDAAARKVIANAKVPGEDIKLGDYFTHGLGHGIGLEIHEAPRVRANSDDVLEHGMVITVEPGIYIPGWGGIRIEDDVLVKPEGAVLLTTLPREIATVE
jgi:Xaa-Pro aminopeptidase